MLNDNLGPISKGTINDFLGEWDDPDSPNTLVRFLEKQVNLNNFYSKK
jgi:hypothetical protein